MLNLGPSATYWFEVASYFAPYATIGSFILSGLSFASEQRQEEELREISLKLDGISQQITDLQRTLLAKLNEMVLKQVVGVVLGVKDSLADYIRLKSIGILDNVVNDSGTAKNIILQYVNDGDTSLEYVFAYVSLYATLMPLRVQAYRLYHRGKRVTHPLVRRELQSFIDMKDRGLAAATNIGKNRVSALNATIEVVDELGPTYGTQFSFTVDGQFRDAGFFNPHGGPQARDLNGIRKRAHEQRDAASVQKVDETVKPLADAFAAAERALGTIPP